VLKNEQHLITECNVYHQMSLSKSKCWYSNYCLQFLKCAVPLSTQPALHLQKLFQGQGSSTVVEHLPHHPSWLCERETCKKKLFEKSIAYIFQWHTLKGKYLRAFIMLRVSCYFSRLGNTSALLSTEPACRNSMLSYTSCLCPVLATSNENFETGKSE